MSPVIKWLKTDGLFLESDDNVITFFMTSVNIVAGASLNTVYALCQQSFAAAT